MTKPSRNGRIHGTLASVAIMVWMLLVSTLAVNNHFELSRLSADVEARIGALEFRLRGPTESDAAPNNVPPNPAQEPDPRRMR